MMATVVAVSSRPRQAGAYTFHAPDAVPSGVAEVIFTLTIDLADKLASGKSVRWGFEFSTDGGATWTLGNQGTWDSYGPAGFIHTDLDGTVVSNPDPRISLALSDRVGQRLRGTLVLSNALRTGVVITVT